VQTDFGGGQNMPLFYPPCSDYPGVMGDFFYCPYLIISSSFSGNADLADEVFDFMRESISVFFTPKQVQAAGRFREKSSSFRSDERIYSRKTCIG
jgi:hypothetical protein